MQNFQNNQNDFIENLNTINKFINSEIKKLFKGKIQPGFLIKIFSIIYKKLGPVFSNYYQTNFNGASLITGINEAPILDICNLIIGTHRHYSIFLDEDEIYLNQRSEEYQEKIASEVIEKIRLRKYASVYFRRFPLHTGEQFLYFPVPYELFAVCMSSFELIFQKEDPVLWEYHSILKKALSALTIVENNLLSSAYPICRSVIEQYIKILFVSKHPESYKEYERFCKFEIDQSCCSKKFPKEFIDLYNKRIYHSKISKINYLHFGWLDSIPQYNIKQSNRYSIYGIIKHLKRDANEKFKSLLNQVEFFYKHCHSYTHGSADNVKYPLLQYFEISKMLSLIIPSVFKAIHSELGLELSQEDQLLLDILFRDLETMNNQHQKCSTENFEKYYKFHR